MSNKIGPPRPLRYRQTPFLELCQHLEKRVSSFLDKSGNGECNGNLLVDNCGLAGKEPKKSRENVFVI